MTDGASASSTAHRNTPSDRQALTSPSSKRFQLIRDPLVHFLLIGAALFGVQAFLQRSTAPSNQRITVTAGKVEHLAALFTRTWQRAPSTEELEGLVNDYIREEVAYREGLRLGLDQDDTIIRRRIRQKLDFFAEDLANQIEPTDEQLAQFWAEHQDAYRVDPRLSFRQLFFDPTRHGSDLEKELAKLREELQADREKDSTVLGDSTLLEHAYGDLSQREVNQMFGEAFGSAIAELEPERWQGPLRSTYGLHLVCVDERRMGRARPLDEVREAVRRDWEHQQRKKLVEDFYRGLQNKYEIAIEWPKAAAKEP